MKDVGIAAATAAATFALGSATQNLHREPSTHQSPEAKPLTDKELTELLLRLNDISNNYNDRLLLANNMANTQKIAELVDRDGLNRFFLGRGSEQNGSFTNEIVVKINRIPDGSSINPLSHDVSTERAAVKYEVTLGPSLAPPVWAEMLFQDADTNPSNRREVSKEDLLNVLERIKQDPQCGKILGATFGEDSTIGLTCVSEHFEPQSIEAYDDIQRLLSGPNFTQTKVVSPNREPVYVSGDGASGRSDAGQVEVQGVPVLTDGRLPQMAPFSEAVAVFEIDTRPQYIANTSRVDLYTHGYRREPVYLTLNHGYSAVVETPYGTYIGTSQKVPGKEYTVFDYSLTRAAVSAFNSPARPAGVLA